jgi:hypothetical protein
VDIENQKFVLKRAAESEPQSAPLVDSPLLLSDGQPLMYFESILCRTLLCSVRACVKTLLSLKTWLTDVQIALRLCVGIALLSIHMSGAKAGCALVQALSLIDTIFIRAAQLSKSDILKT